MITLAEGVVDLKTPILFVIPKRRDYSFIKEGFGKISGKDQMNLTDAYGEKTTIVGIHAIRNGTGYVHGMFADTSTGSERPVPKLMYMKAVDDTWWIGSGIYSVDVR
jgi:signal transduction histidine kinase